MNRDILHACPFRKFHPDHAVGLAGLVAFDPGDRDLRLNRAVGAGHFASGVGELAETQFHHPEIMRTPEQ